jgi:Icc-related predicted phosphoesterase
MRIAATADIHYGKHSKGKADDLFEKAAKVADVLLICGDLTDYGLAEEAELLAADIRSHARLPIIGVLGNHDFESAQPTQVRGVLEAAGVTVLDGEATQIKEVGFAGVCGFGGGFGRRMLNAWGEPLIKTFVQEAIDHSVRLEQALATLQTSKRVVLLHYSPIRATVTGEDPEIFPFLGSTRLEEPINRFRVDLVLHGHAHNGTADGLTSTGILTHNVSYPLQIKNDAHSSGFRIFEI